MGFLQDKIYPAMPVTVQNLMISAFGYQWKRRRFGGCFTSFYKETLEREFFSADQWRAYQTDRLRKLLVHAFRNVSFYREKYKSAGITEADLTNIRPEDLKLIPFLEKDELRRHGEGTMLAEGHSRGTFISSSGSTGTPVRVFMPEYFHQQWTAIMEARVRNWAGVNRSTPRGMIGGRRILPDADYKLPLYRYNIFEKQTYFSAYHISPSTAEDYVRGMKENNVRFMTGYAMSNFLLANFIKEKELQAPAMEAVITSSEKLTPEMKSTIEDVYGCRCYDSYSGCEACGLISETPEGALVVSPDAGIMEFLNPDGSDCLPGGTGEIVSTGLLNFDQPLIRYRIGDMATLSSDQSPAGGRHMIRIDSITGRIEDTVICRDGRRMVRFHSLFVDIPGLKTGQVVQHEYERFTLRLITDNSFFRRESAEALLKSRLESQTGRVRIDFEYPEKLDLSPNGKIRAVISLVKKD